MRAFITLLLLVCAGSLASPLSAAETVESQLKAMESDVAALKTIHKQILSQVKPKTGQALTVRLILTELIAWHDRWGSRKTAGLELTIYAFNGHILASPAIAPGWSQARHWTDASGLTVTPTSVKGTLKIVIGTGTGAHNAAAALDATIKGGTVTGTYRLDRRGGPVGRIAGSVSGTAGSDRTSFRLPPKPKEDPLASIHSYRYQKAQWLDRTSAALYQDIRAAAMARNNGVALAHARRLVRTFPATYPELPKLTKSGKVEKKGKAPTLDDATDDMMELGLEDEVEVPVVTRKKGKKGGSTKKRADGDDKIVKALLGFLAPIRERTSLRSSLAAAAGNGKVNTITGSQDTGDPHFGPWYGEGPLPSKGKQKNVVPAADGSWGIQLWPWVENWTCLGTFPADDGLVDTPALPEFISAAGSRYPVDRRWKGGKDNKAPDVFKAGPSEVEHGTGLVRAPWQTAFEDHGFKRINYELAQTYHVSEVFAEKPGEVWAGMTVDDHAKLWVNGKLVWRSPRDRNPWECQSTYVFKISLKKGANALVARCENLLADSCFCLRICIRGRPRPAAAAKAAVATLNDAHRKLGVPTKGTQGCG